MAGRFSVETIFKARDLMSGTIAKIQARTALMTKSISKDFDIVSKNVSAFGGSLKTVATAGVAASVVLGAGMFGMAQTGMEFEQTLANIRAVAKPTNAELDQMSKTALKVGSDFGFSGSSVAASMESMAKQGLSVQEVVAGIGGVAAAASADGSTLEETMGGLLATMAGLGKGAGDLQHIADVMAKAGDATAASIGTLSQSMAVFGPTARAMGISVESAIGQLAILQDAGIDASSAGTTLSAVYSKLASPTKQTADQLKKLGLSVEDAFGNMKPPEQLMSEIFKATQGIKGNVGQAAAITELVGLNSQKALLNIAAAVGSGKFDKVMGSLTEGVDGYAEAVAKIKQDSTAGDIAKMAASWEALKIELFGLVSADLRGKVVQPVTEWIGANKGLIGSKFLEFMTSAKQLAADVRDNFDSIVTWTKRIAVAAAAFYVLRTAVMVTQTAMAAYAIVVNSATWASNAMGAASTREAVAIGASRAATIIATTARGAYSLAIGIGTVATTSFTLAEVRSKVALVASNVVTWLATTARGAFAAASTLAATGATALGVAAMGSVPGIAASTAALAPFLATVLALTAALAALAIAWNENEKLKSATGGMGMLDIGAEMWKQGTWDPFKAVDAVANEKAQLKAAMGEQGPAPLAPMVTPQERVAQSVSETSTTTKSEVVLKPAPGMELEQTKGPKRTPGLKLHPTGGM